MNILQIIPCTKDLYARFFWKFEDYKEIWTEKVVCFALIENDQGDYDSKKVVGMIAREQIEVAEFDDKFTEYDDTPFDNR